MSKKQMTGWIAAGVVGVLLAGLGLFLDKKNTLYVYGADGTEVAGIYLEGRNLVYECEDGNRPYAELVFSEAVAVVEEQTGCDEAEAVYTLTHSGMSVHTYYRRDIMEQIRASYEERKEYLTGAYAVVVNDVHGRVLACYSASVTGGDGKNYVMEPTYAASTMKMLSVYGPSVESGQIAWGSLEEDSPVTQVQVSDGHMEDWPQNVSPYRYQDVTIAEAVQKSLNTIAVKTLKRYGTGNSCDFLEDKLGMDLALERRLMDEYGEDEVLGDLALGYLKDGVTAENMAGYYQIFANGGTYIPSHATLSILQNGRDYYRAEETETRVLSTETAYICNRMMKLVTQEGGTAAGVAVEGLDICGKTGTSADYADNWFIGLTPEYVCAVWFSVGSGTQYGLYALEADSEEYAGRRRFALNTYMDVMRGIPSDPSAAYPVGAVTQYDICKESGLRAGDTCRDVWTGYYREGEEVGECRLKH